MNSVQKKNMIQNVTAKQNQDSEATPPGMRLRNKRLDDEDEMRECERMMMWTEQHLPRGKRLCV